MIELFNFKFKMEINFVLQWLGIGLVVVVDSIVVGETIVQTPYGYITGDGLDVDGVWVNIYYDIPYAEPPTGIPINFNFSFFL